MVLSIQINQTQYRNDSTVFPRITVAGYSDTPFIKLATWQYFKVTNSSMVIEPNNRSLPDCPVSIRNTFHNSSTWVKDANSGDFSIVPFSPNGFYRNGGSVGGSWQGAYYNAALSGNIVSVQAKARSIQNVAGISLQNSPFTTHVYNNQVAHAIIFGQNGKLAIFELGVQPKSLAANFKYALGDVAMIEYDRIKNLVRYYLIHGREMILLRTTRPKFTTANQIAEIMLFQPNSSLEDIFVSNGNEVTTTFENIAVARRKVGETTWQNWKNPRNRVSNADPIQLADGEFEFTFPNSKKISRQNSLTPKAFKSAGFQTLEDFFNWHGNEKEFLFVDEARKDSLGVAQEFWVRFVSGMPDTTGNGCIYDYNVQVAEVYRSDYVPRVLDVQLPNVVLDANSGPAGLPHFVAHTSDDVGTRYAQIFVDGIQNGATLYTDGSEVYEFDIDSSGLAAGSHTVNCVAFDFAGNRGVSNNRTLTVA